MNLFLFIKQAFSSIKSNKLRSFLSTLWIMIGISSFVIMLSIWEWAKQSILKSMSQMGNVINVSESHQKKNSEVDVFTDEIANEIQKKVPYIEKVIPIYNSPNAQVSYNSKRINSRIQAIWERDLQYKGVKMKHGSYFSNDDFKKKKKLIIIGNGLVKKSEYWASSPFVGTIPIWKKISIWWEDFIISGILEEKSWEFDNSLYIPLSTYKSLVNNAKITKIEVYATDENVVDKAKENLAFYFYKKFWLKKWTSLPVSLRTNKESLKQINDMNQKFTLLLGGIWAIALIVGWIGIMNIMVVSVTERTREIGIRKAIWATNKNIMMQFLVESIILTLFWSFIAVLFSYWIVELLWKLLGDFKPVINFYVLVIATSVSVCMWIIFGLMPAYKAAKLKVIDALHFE